MDRDRRRICQAGLALGAAAVLPACGSSDKMNEMCSGSAIGVGNAADVPMNGLVQVPTALADGDSVLVCHDAGGYYAMDGGCTHLGCDVMLKAAGDLEQGFYCMCHGATYDANGQNPTTPAPRPLKHYLMCAQPSGALLVDVGMEVDPKVRLKP